MAKNGPESQTYDIGPHGSIWTTRGNSDESKGQRVRLISNWSMSMASR